MIGGRNVKREVGLFAAVITASYDTTKGLIAMAISLWIFKFPLFWVYMSGIGAIAGHLFPFYLKFKGGRGVATARGMLLISLFEISVHMNFHVLIGDIIYLVFFVLCIYFTEFPCPDNITRAFDACGNKGWFFECFTLCHHSYDLHLCDKHDEFEEVEDP